MITLDWRAVATFAELNARMKDFMVLLRRFSPTTYHAFFQDNVAANQTEVVLGIGMGAVNGYVMPRAGHVIGVAVHSNDARTAGQLNVYPAIDGVALASSAQLDATNTATHTMKVSKDLDSAFLAGARIGALITTTAAWAPTTADIVAAVLVQLSMED